MKLASVLLLGSLAAAQSAGLDTVLERLDAYLDRYETELSAVVADEELIQETDGRLNRRMNQRLQSEIAFLRLPGGLEWMGFRRVRSINGKPLTGTRTLAELLATTSTDALQQASLLVERKRQIQPGEPAHHQHAEPAARAVEPEISPSLRGEPQRQIQHAGPRHRRSGAHRRSGRNRLSTTRVV